MEELKSKGVTYWMVLIRSAFYCRRIQGSKWQSGYRSREIESSARRSAFSQEQVTEFYDWITTDEGQEWFAQKSPSNAAGVAIRNRMRFCPAAEKYIINKAKDRGRLLEYCITFGIVLDNMEKVTLKAAFDDDSKHQKRYIKHIQETKKKLKDFLVQLISTNQIDSNKTVKELLETL